MARATITPTALTLGAMVAEDAGDELVAADGAVLEAQAHPVLLVIKNGAEAARTVTIAAGVQPPAMTPLEVEQTIAAGDVYLYPIQRSGGGRHAQADGSVYIDVDDANVTVAAYELPAGLV